MKHKNEFLEYAATIIVISIFLILLLIAAECTL